MGTELEQPFGLGANHLQLTALQRQFNSKLARFLDQTTPPLGYLPPVTSPAESAASTRTASCLSTASAPRAGARGSLPGDLFSTHEDADDLEEEILKESAGAPGFAPVAVGSS